MNKIVGTAIGYILVALIAIITILMLIALVLGLYDLIVWLWSLAQGQITSIF